MSKDEASEDAEATGLIFRDAEERALWRAVLLTRLLSSTVTDAVYSADAVIRAHRARIS